MPLVCGVYADGSHEAARIARMAEQEGASALLVLRPLGTTVHGYPDGDTYAVKTTHWFWMQTPEQNFEPQSEEEIDAVEWKPWSEARAMLDYETLRRHMDEAADIVMGR